MSFWNSHSEKQKETGKGVLKVIGEYQLSSELQQFVDEEKAKAANETAKLMMYLFENGRVDDAEKAENFIQWIEDMKRKMNIPEKLDMIKDVDVDQIIKWAMKEANPLYPTPVLWKRSDFRRFIDSVRA